MSSTQKLLQKLTATPTPADFKWSDLVTLLNRLGFQTISGSGSRYKFFKPDTKDVISLHKPHPASTLKRYAVRNVVRKLEEMGLVQ